MLRIKHLFKDTFKTIFPYHFEINEIKKPLTTGRWKNDDCDNSKNIKVDYSNVDHCGPCGVDELYSIKKNNISDQNVIDNTSKN